MKDSLDRIALGLALAAAALAPFSLPPGWSNGLACLSLAPAAARLFLRPARALDLAGFLALGVLVLLLEWPLPPRLEAGWIPLVVLGIQARLYFLREGEARRALNRGFARELREAMPDRCVIFVDTDIETESPTAALRAEHIVRVQPGELLPGDGVVSLGSGFAEELLLTGDPEPVAKGMGKFVFAGSKSRNSSFLFRVTQAGRDTFLLRKAAFLDGGFGRFPFGSARYLWLEATALATLLALHVSVPDAAAAMLGAWLASAGAYFAAAKWDLRLAFVARSAASGTLWSSPRAVARVAEARTLVLDPEGSVTEGSLRLSGVATDEELGEDGALRLAAPLARRIESPAAFCLLKELKTRNIPLAQLDAYFPAPGGGYGIVSDSEVRLCDEATAVREDIPYAKFHAFLRQEMSRPGASAHLLLKNGAAMAAFTFVDSIRDPSAETVRQIQRAGRSVVFVSSARKESVAALARELGVEHFHAEAGGEAASELMTRLGKEKLSPLWLDNGVAPLPAGDFPRLGCPPAGIQVDGTCARGDLRSHWQALRLALTLRLYFRRLFLAALGLQLGLSALSVYRPVLGAVAATVLLVAALRAPARKMAAGPLPY